MDIGYMANKMRGPALAVSIALATSACAAPQLELGTYHRPNTTQEQMLKQRAECYTRIEGASYQRDVDRAYQKRNNVVTGGAIVAPILAIIFSPEAGRAIATVREESARAEEIRETSQNSLDDAMEECMATKEFK